MLIDASSIHFGKFSYERSIDPILFANCFVYVLRNRPVPSSVARLFVVLSAVIN